MNKDQIIKWLAVAGGAYLVYWYLTSYGPDGSVAEGHASYWSTWFGGATAGAVAAGAGAAAPAGTTGAGAGAGTGAGATHPATSTPAQPVTLKDKILSAARVTAGATMSADQWNYYRNIVAPPALTGEQFGNAFPDPRGSGSAGDPNAAMTVDQFLARISAAGLSGVGSIVRVQSAPSIPSMSFGGSLRRPNLQGLRRNAPGMGGGYVQ